MTGLRANALGLEEPFPQIAEHTLLFCRRFADQLLIREQTERYFARNIRRTNRRPEHIGGGDHDNRHGRLENVHRVRVHGRGCDFDSPHVNPEDVSSNVVPPL